MVLCYLGHALEVTCGVDSMIGRCGGDEFMVVLPNTCSAAAAQVAEEIYNQIEDVPFRMSDGVLLPLQLTIGIAGTFSAGPFPAAVVAAADGALYDGKAGGGGQIVVSNLQGAGQNPLVKSSFDSLDALVAFIDSKDHYTRRHPRKSPRTRFAWCAHWVFQKKRATPFRLRGFCTTLAKSAFRIPSSENRVSCRRRNTR